MADDIDKALTALETEKARRLQAKIDAGEVVVRSVGIAVSADDDDEEEEDAVEKALASLPALDPDGRPYHNDLTIVVTGVPRSPDHGNWKEACSPQVQASEEGASDNPPSPAAGSGVLTLCAPSQPTYVRVTIRNGDDEGDAGQISEALWSVEDACVVLTDLEGRHLTSRALLKTDDPAAVARSLLRERERPNDFNRPLHYPKMGLA
jgi:hypothetical protein